RYVTSRMRKFDITEQTLGRNTLMANLIVPAYQQGLARCLHRAGVALALYGDGWDQIGEFRDIAKGPVRSRTQLQSAIASAKALVHVWPVMQLHPIEFCGRAVVRPGRTSESFLRGVKSVLAGKFVLPTHRGPFLS